MKKNKRMYYFAYGSNLNHDQFFMRCPSSEYFTNGKMENYNMEFLTPYRTASGVMNIFPMSCHTIEGAIYDIGEDDLKKLDRYEGYPTLYYREVIKVLTNEGIYLDCIVYFMNKKINEFIVKPPSEFYYNTILQGLKDCNISNEKFIDHVDNVYCK